MIFDLVLERSPLVSLEMIEGLLALMSRLRVSTTEEREQFCSKDVQPGRFEGKSVICPISPAVWWWPW